MLLKTTSQFLLDLGDYILQVGVRERLAVPCQYLYDKDGVDLGIVLLIAILVPVDTFLHPLLGSRLQHGHIVIFLWIGGVSDQNAIF